MKHDTLARIGFVYPFQLRDANGKLLAEGEAKNVFVTQGLNYVMDSALGTLNKIATFYLGLFEANYTPILADVAATFPGAATETTAYDEVTRRTFSPNAVANGTINNTGNEGAFTFNANKTIYGAFLTSAQGKGATTGVLVSAAKFSSPQVVAPGNILYLGAGGQIINI